MGTITINAVQQGMIDKLIAHFETLGQRPDRMTVKALTNVMAITEPPPVVFQVRRMMDGKATGGGFVYDHPGAYAIFYGAFQEQWNIRHPRN
jgi:hypothetical protein